MFSFHWTKNEYAQVFQWLGLDYLGNHNDGLWSHPTMYPSSLNLVDEVGWINLMCRFWVWLSNVVFEFKSRELTISSLADKVRRINFEFDVWFLCWLDQVHMKSRLNIDVEH